MIETLLDITLVLIVVLIFNGRPTRRRQPERKLSPTALRAGVSARYYEGR